jgi:hypothetical protein
MQPFPLQPPAVPASDSKAAATDPFVDGLFDKLDTDRQKTLSQAASATERRERVTAAERGWWDEFCQILDHKVAVWNAKDAPHARVTFTRNASGSIQIWHRAVEAELSLVEIRVVMTGRIGNTRPRESPFIEFNEARGRVAAILTGENSSKSPAEAADHFLAPILTQAFTVSHGA